MQTRYLLVDLAMIKQVWIDKKEMDQMDEENSTPLFLRNQHYEKTLNDGV